ncbi:unnamed protein product [Rangifer tarandus platyrhynchus]|uniref:Uncharacterized protein n=2 Tax=Rangifer tarandus platyrhynchus TaxID=3082113 RepID=A0ACB0EG81_RANTA|nr:unnamed protein product [Rangifer tarandus platyrhynchus]
MGSSLGAGGRAVLGRLALLWALVVPGNQQDFRVLQSSVMVGHAGRAITMSCRVSRSVDYVHWFRQLEGQAPERLLYLALSKRDVQWDSVLRGDKVNAARGSDDKSCTMSLMKLAKSDEGMYYCAAWRSAQHSGWKKMFGEGIQLIVAPWDKKLPADTSPKPTIFLPSINEVNHQQAATYLCLLEKFFPDVVKVSWKEKNGNRVLPSQQGNTMKTNDTYMKLSWLTVTENSMKKEHVCIVKHEKNPGRKDQEILFPAVNEVFTPVVTTTEPPNDCLKDESEVTDTDFTKACARDQSKVANSTKACLKDENNTVPLHFTYNSAYYTYLVLLLKSAVYFAITSFCVFRRTGVCCDGTSS